MWLASGELQLASMILFHGFDEKNVHEFSKVKCACGYLFSHCAWLN
jgi:hypothetical protein